MARVPPDKRTQVILVAVGSVIVLALFWFLVIRAEQRALQAKRRQSEEAASKVGAARKLLARDEEIKENLDTATRKVQAIEAQMPTGDKYSWIRKTIREFQAPFRVEIPTFNPPQDVEMDLSPKFPYRAASFSIGGTAYYHDFGRFLASFENQFPYMRVQNLEIEPVPPGGAATPEEREKLTFRMEIVTLVKPN